MKHLLLGATVVLGAAGCAHQPTLPDNATSCPSPRPAMCTMDYRPVVGYFASGTKAGEYSNACNACSQRSVNYTVPANKL
ncbi:hypothetical protein CEK62_15645 [Alcanivorax sp. N3-2A]|nr:hypothetical protein CEK62_15645 [Alcanivorax sp. N3-2A]